jgi:alpha-D-ribose 1-methylphosphonate 5-triphosphate synthase subunit PhnI
MYVAVKGGQKAIEEAHRQLAEARRGSLAVPEISVCQIQEQLSLAVDRVQAEGSLYAPETAALAVKQARGDLVEAAFIV